MELNNLDLFRPNVIYNNVLAQRERDAADFFAKFHNFFVDIPCPACGATGDEAYIKWDYSHKRCPNCRSIFVSPRPGEELLSYYYNNCKAPSCWNEVLEESIEPRRQAQYKPRIELIVDLLKDQKVQRLQTAVDLGAGTGEFALCLQDTGLFRQVLAVDISQTCVDICQSKSVNALLGSIKDLSDASIDFIAMNDLIEHLFDPLDHLLSCGKVLRPGGYVFLVTPNVCGFDHMILKERSNSVSPPEHLNLFNPDSIAGLLEKAGFEPVLVATPGVLDVELVLTEYRKDPGLLSGNEWLEELFTQAPEVLGDFQSYLARSRMSGHMLVMAKNKKGRT